MISTCSLLLGMTPPSGQGFNPVSFLFPAAIFAVFYFVVFAPMRKKQKRHDEMLRALKPGDRVLTNGGIWGTVVAVQDDLLQLRIADQVKVEVSRGAIASVQEPASK